MRRSAPSVVTDDVARHPAVEAWARTGPDRPVPERVVVLHEARRRSVYQLPGVGRDGGSVIAKRCRVPVARLEKAVYEDMLPHLPFASPHYYGSWFDGPRGWVLLEDVSGEPFLDGDVEHTRLASRWMATLHSGATCIAAAKTLPDAGAGRYLDHLVQGRAKICKALECWPFLEDEIEVLDTLVARGRDVETQWPCIRDLCEGVPDTLVHGDFQPKNAFLSEEGGGRGLRIIDWEMAGFGCPAADLTRIDLDLYGSAIRAAWPEMTLDRVRTLAKAGQVFRALAEVHWLTESLQLDCEKTRKFTVDRLIPLVDRLADTATAAIQTG